MQDWIRIAKSDNPLISGLETETKFRDSITEFCCNTQNHRKTLREIFEKR